MTKNGYNKIDKGDFIMKNKKIVITLLTILIVMLAMVGESFAADSFSAGLTPNSSRVNKGDVVKVTFKLSSINVDGGVNGITATLKYDSDVLTVDEDVAELNDWSVTFNKNNGNLAFEKQDPITNDEEIATFSFKVSDNTSATSSTIKLVSIKGANSSLNDDVSISDISTTITIASASVSETPEPTVSESPSPSISVVPSPTVTTTATATSNGTTVYNGNMADTGSTPNYVIPLIIAIAVLGIISFINYKKIDNKK